MKLLFNLIKVALIFIIIGGCFYLLINKTFIYEVYKTDIMDDEGIPIKRFMYVVDNEDNLDAKFYTILSNKNLEDMKKSYLDKLENCYGKYYYDKDNNITITNYNIVNKSNYRLVNISYVSDNYCSDEYKLSDMWVYDYINKSTYLNGDITEKTMASLVDKIYRSKKSDAYIKEYTSKYSYKVNCKNDEGEYTLIFEDFSENELLVKKEIKENTSFSVYKIENVVEYLKGLK